MATQWEDTIQGQKLYGAYGTRDILLIAQDDCLQGPDIQQRQTLELTDSDKNQLERLGIPLSDKLDDTSIMEARCALVKNYTLLPIERVRPGGALSKGYVLSKIENYMKTTMKDGLTIKYFGPGKQKTGDWCFRDGFITFREVAELYLQHFKGRVLTIHTDCSYAGSWVKAMVEFLEELGTKPCGHSLKEKGILMKVFASCKSNQIAHRLVYSLRGATTDKNSGVLSFGPSGKEIEKAQNVKILDATVIRCEHKSIDEPCTLRPDYTWKTITEFERVKLVKGKDRDRPAWHYVLLVEDEETIEKFHEKTDAGRVDVAKYGEVLESGWGKEPPNEVKDRIERKYFIVYQ